MNYWQVGEYISRKIDADAWGKGTVKALSIFVQLRQPGLSGFSPQNLWRMRQFYDAYRDHPKLSTLLRELPWSSNLHILTRAKLPEEREFYLRMATQNRWQVREEHSEGDLHRALINHLGQFLTELGSDFCYVGSEFPLQVGGVRFRTLGCWPLTAAIESDATTLDQVIAETLGARGSEREGRLIDSDVPGSMEKKKQEGYF